MVAELSVGLVWEPMESYWNHLMVSTSMFVRVKLRHSVDGSNLY